jgi:hypothetical protein
VEGNAKEEGWSVREEDEGQSMTKAGALAIAREIVRRAEKTAMLPRPEREALIDRMMDPEYGPLTEEDMLALGRFSYRQIRRIKKKKLQQADRLLVKALQELKK